MNTIQKNYLEARKKYDEVQKAVVSILEALNADFENDFENACKLDETIRKELSEFRISCNLREAKLDLLQWAKNKMQTEIPDKWNEIADVWDKIVVYNQKAVIDLALKLA